MRPNLNELQSRSFDVAIVGGGINGTSTAAKLAQAGYSVLLVDRADYGSGSSSRSSRILHCGLNYLALAHGAPTLAGKLLNLRLAREMMQCRKDLARSLGPRCKPTPFFIPMRAGDPPPWQVGAAFTVLKSLGGYGVPLDIRQYDRRAMGADAMLSQLAGDVRSVASFTEYVFDWPERICIDYAMQAQILGATLRNYTEVTGATPTSHGWELELRDAQSQGDRASASARMVLNLTGPWADTTNKLFGAGLPPTVTMSKGCHLTAKLPAEFRGKGLISRNATGHLFICVPWGELHILGPTETRFAGDPRDVRADTRDIKLILDSANSLLPRSRLTENDIIMKWAGVRPATYGEGAPHGLWEKRIHDHSSTAGAPLVSLSWGRLADHHLTAAELARITLGKLGAAHRHVAAPSIVSNGGGEQAAAVADVLFRRAGRAWSGRVTAEEVRQTAESVAGATAQQPEALANRFFDTMEHEFGRPMRAGADAQYQAAQ